MSYHFLTFFFFIFFPHYSNCKYLKIYIIPSVLGFFHIFRVNFCTTQRGGWFFYFILWLLFLLFIHFLLSICCHLKKLLIFVLYFLGFSIFVFTWATIFKYNNFILFFVLLLLSATYFTLWTEQTIFFSTIRFDFFIDCRFTDQLKIYKI